MSSIDHQSVNRNTFSQECVDLSKTCWLTQQLDHEVEKKIPLPTLGEVADWMVELRKSCDEGDVSRVKAVLLRMHQQEGTPEKIDTFAQERLRHICQAKTPAKIREASYIAHRWIHQLFRVTPNATLAIRAVEYHQLVVDERFDLQGEFLFSASTQKEVLRQKLDDLFDKVYYEGILGLLDAIVAADHACRIELFEHLFERVLKELERCISGGFEGGMWKELFVKMCKVASTEPTLKSHYAPDKEHAHRLFACILHSGLDRCDIWETFFALQQDLGSAILSKEKPYEKVVVLALQHDHSRFFAWLWVKGSAIAMQERLSVREGPSVRYGTFGEMLIDYNARKTLTLLCDLQPEVKDQPMETLTLLMYAAHKDQAPAIEQLLLLGCDKAIKTASEKTAQSFACESGSRSTLVALSTTDFTHREMASAIESENAEALRYMSEVDEGFQKKMGEPYEGHPNLFLFALASASDEVLICLIERISDLQKLLDVEVAVLPIIRLAQKSAVWDVVMRNIQEMDLILLQALPWIVQFGASELLNATLGALKRRQQKLTDTKYLALAAVAFDGGSPTSAPTSSGRSGYLAEVLHVVWDYAAYYVPILPSLSQSHQDDPVSPIRHFPEKIHLLLPHYEDPAMALFTELQTLIDQNIHLGILESSMHPTQWARFWTLQNQRKQNPLHMLLVSGRGGDVQHMGCIPQAAFEQVDTNGNPPLHLAYHGGFDAVIPALLERQVEKRAILQLKNSRGQTLSSLAESAQNRALVQQLESLNSPQPVTE